jgi:hypothetical protein
LIPRGLNHQTARIAEKAAGMTAPSIHQSGLGIGSASRRLDRSRIAARRGSTIRESIVIAEPWMMTSDSKTHIRVSKFPIGKYFLISVRESETPADEARKAALLRTR